MTWVMVNSTHIDHELDGVKIIPEQYLEEFVFLEFVKQHLPILWCQSVFNIRQSIISILYDNVVFPAE